MIAKITPNPKLSVISFVELIVFIHYLNSCKKCRYHSMLLSDGVESDVLVPSREATFSCDKGKAQSHTDDHCESPTTIEDC